MKIVKIKFRTRRNEIVEGYFIKTPLGYKPIFIEDSYLDTKSNEILNIENDPEFNL